MGEDFPRILITRKVEKDGSKYFGPYSSRSYVNDTIEVIKKIFPIRTCKKEFPRDIGKERPCLNFFIGQCLAPCQGGINKEEYKNMMKDVCLFLGGKHQDLIEKLQEDMLESSKNLNFEKAASLRNKINSLKHIAERQKIISTAMEDQDVIAFATKDGEAAIQIFFIRGGKLIGRENFVMDGTQDTPRNEILCEFIKQFYSSTDFVPKEILLQEEIDEINIIESWLTSKRGAKVHLRVPKKGEKHDLIDMVYKNAAQALETLESRVRAERMPNQEALGELKVLLDLEKIPSRIEAYDISNIQGSLSVGTMVVFTDGRMDKSEYRKFRIKSVEGPNDYMSMQEVLFRRFNNKEKFPDAPDLICVDGGKGHVNAVLEVLKEVGKNVPVCGMVKNEKHKTRGIIYNNSEIVLSSRPKLFKFITEIQDEVHRFSIEYHRNLRKKELQKSVLDDIEGIGDKRKKALLRHFKSISNIRNASVEELLKAEGMNKSAAEKVFDFFANRR